MEEDSTTRHSVMSFDNESQSQSSIHQKLGVQRTDVCSYEESYSAYYRKQKKTKPYLTKYEKTKLLGVRAQMLANGAKPLVHVPPFITKTIDIANLEFQQKRIPLFIRRHLPNGETEDWRLEDLTYM